MGASASNQNFTEHQNDPATGAAILIADDDPAIRLVLRHRLEAGGYRVEEAVDSPLTEHKCATDLLWNSRPCLRSLSGRTQRRIDIVRCIARSSFS